MDVLCPVIPYMGQRIIVQASWYIHHVPCERLNGTGQVAADTRHGLVSPLKPALGAVPGNGRPPADPVGTAARKGRAPARGGAGRRWLPPGRATRWPAGGAPGVLHAVSPRCPAFRRPSLARSISRWDWTLLGLGVGHGRRSSSIAPLNFFLRDYGPCFDPKSKNLKIL